MPLTPEQIAKIRQKEAATPDALKRNPLNAYTEGWFHVTLNVRGEAPVLGYIVGDAEAPDGTANAPRCILTDLGRKVEAEWRGIGRYYPECICEEIQVMPEHIHALMHLLPANKAHLGRIINGLMIGCTHAYWDTLGIPWRKMRQQIEETLKRKMDDGVDSVSAKEQSKALRAEWQDRDHTRSYRGPALFVRGYNDVEAIGEEEIEIKRQYIRNNPRKRLITRSKPDAFRVRRNMTSDNWTPQRIMKGLCADRFIAADRAKQIQAWQQIAIKGIRNNRGKISATLKFKTLPADTTTADAGTDTTAVDAGTTTTAAGTNTTTPPTTTTTPAAGTTVSRPVLDLVGNMGLLQRPLFPLVCHRADAALYEQQKEAVMKVATKVAATLSILPHSARSPARNSTHFLRVMRTGISLRERSFQSPTPSLAISTSRTSQANMHISMASTERTMRSLLSLA